MSADARSDARTTVLERIVQSTREEVERRKESLPLGELADRASVGDGERRFHRALAATGIGVIAEFKRRSPSAGRLREDPDVKEMVSAYERGGASAVSVLTEGPNFDGSLEDLRAAREACDLPLLRKDFIVDQYQLHEARAAGADAVLLIVAALDAGALARLYGEACALKLEVLVEVHDHEELQSALSVGADTIGINNRDLRDFSVEVERTFRLMSEMPAEVTVVSESGIATAEQLRRLRDAGVQAVLVGESLMRASNPESALRALRRDSDA
jgi:indole-3-glycerol phosphate synthase